MSNSNKLYIKSYKKINKIILAHIIPFALLCPVDHKQHRLNIMKTGIEIKGKIPAWKIVVMSLVASGIVALIGYGIYKIIERGY